MILEFMYVVSVQRFEFFFLENIVFIDAENPMNYTTTSVYLNIDDHQLNKNVTCASLKDCHQHGKCLIINQQLKCL